MFRLITALLAALLLAACGGTGDDDARERAPRGEKTPHAQAKERP